MQEVFIKWYLLKIDFKRVHKEEMENVHFYYLIPQTVKSQKHSGF